MAIKTKADLLSAIKDYIGEDTSDKAIALTEDISDTLGDFENKTKDQTDWKEKYTQLDNSWREKYRNRFFNSSAGNDAEGDDDQSQGNPPVAETKSFEDLFTTEK